MSEPRSAMCSAGNPQPLRCDGRRSRPLGFTLVELIVVFALLALLLTLAVPRYMKSEEAARHKVREQNMSTVRDAIDKFKADQGRFPASLDELVSKRYLRQVPVDPVTASTAWRTRPSPVEGEAGVFDLEAPATPVEQAEPAAPLAAPPATTPVAAPAASNS